MATGGLSGFSPLRQAWTESGKLAGASDDQAKRWIASDALLWAVVIKPWVLVQEIETGT